MSPGWAWVADDRHKDGSSHIFDEPPLVADFLPLRRTVARWRWAEGHPSWSLSETIETDDGFRRVVRNFGPGPNGAWMALDTTIFEFGNTFFAEVDQRRHADGPNLHQRPLRLPGRLETGRSYPLGSGWVRGGPCGVLRVGKDEGGQERVIRCLSIEAGEGPPPEEHRPDPEGRTTPQECGTYSALEAPNQGYLQVLGEGIGELALLGPNGWIRWVEAIFPMVPGFLEAEPMWGDLPPLPTLGGQAGPVPRASPL